MINRQVLAHDLNLLLGGETRSLLRHLDIAKPYVTMEFSKAWSDIEKMIAANRNRANRLSALLHEFDLPMQFISLNYGQNQSCGLLRKRQMLFKRR